MAAAADDILRRVPPQNIEAEQSVLGAILLLNEAINQALEILVPEDFYRESHRQIFRAMAELTDKNQPVDAITLT
ncbi:MAG: DnaB-like helicase N-terminal domain-containing protein, partial [Candidatus Binataceae bacterium]